MAKYDYDFFVIGAGSAGVRAARMAAGFGARTGICEDKRLGGTCVNVGCVPKKLLVYGAGYAADFQDAAGYGWTVGETSFNWGTLIANKDEQIARLNGVYERLLEGVGVQILRGRGVLVDAHTVSVAGEQVTAEHILIATGGQPNDPDIPGGELVMNSDAVFALPELPQSVIVLGGGYIGVEFAGIFHGLGAHVTQLYRGSLFLRGFDDDVRHHLADELRRSGGHYGLATQCIGAGMGISTVLEALH